MINKLANRIIQTPDLLTAKRLADTITVLTMGNDKMLEANKAQILKDIGE